MNVSLNNIRLVVKGRPKITIRNARIHVRKVILKRVK